jgi:ribosomal 50S subunit-recycling heat shock protein
MAKPRNKPDADAPPQVGDKVMPPRSVIVYEIMRVHIGGKEVDLRVPGTNLERCQVQADTLLYVERTSSPLTKADVTVGRH